jgi:hypothetical protein
MKSTFVGIYIQTKGTKIELKKNKPVLSIF